MKHTIEWAAGIYEGEGSIGFNGGKKQANRAIEIGHAPSVFIVVYQKERWILYKIKRLVGGTISKPRKADGCSGWFLYGKKATMFITKIYPLLSPRRQRQARRYCVVLGRKYH